MKTSADTATTTHPARKPRRDRARPSDGFLEASPEQKRYARVIEKGVWIGLLCLLVSFILYVSGAWKPRVPLSHLPRVWKLPVHEYLRETNAADGWGWITMVGSSDYANFIGIAVLGGVTAIAYLSVVPMFLRRRDALFAVLCLLEVAVLVCAASGLLRMGH